MALRLLLVIDEDDNHYDGEESIDEEPEPHRVLPTSSSPSSSFRVRAAAKAVGSFHLGSAFSLPPAGHRTGHHAGPSIIPSPALPTILSSFYHWYAEHGSCPGALLPCGSVCRPLVFPVYWTPASMYIKQFDGVQGKLGG